VDRLISRIGDEDFSAVVRIAIGAACCPTHAVEAASLEQRAMSHFTVNWRTPPRASADES